ncbi:MAG: phosphatase PAP2 family protein [Candidatus Lokiarchaeota archaeon]|nr:phosphatase PAP2 family protein [Candidatus Lokiarchaeota archaeon]
MEFKEFSNWVDQWDQKIILKYNGLGGKFTTFILKVFSFFGRETLWLCLMAFYLLIWYDPFLLSFFSATFLTGVMLILAIKQAVKRDRPFERHEMNKIIVFGRKPTSRSFPSWHSYNVVSNGLLIGLFFLNSPIITILFLISAIIVSFSRIQLGVHYPTDVIFGSIFGGVGFLITLYLIGPLMFNLLSYLEQVSIYQIQYRQLNSMLVNSIGYLLLTLSIFFIIFLLALIKTIKDFVKKE